MDIKHNDLTTRTLMQRPEQCSILKMMLYTRALPLVLVVAVLLLACGKKAHDDDGFFKTRGVVLAVEDLSTVDWPAKAHASGINTIATHITPSQVATFIQSPRGQQFLRECKELGIEVEHELHAMNDLLPRELFAEDSTMFRMNEKGRRVADYNLCVHSEKALNLASDNAVKFARILTPTTGRYFYWIDDNMPMCHCGECSQYSDSEQALILENHMIKRLREFDPRATLAHLAYGNTLEAPRKVKPEAGVFLEFAPIQRSFSQPISDEQAKVIILTDHAAKTHGDILKMLDENLEVFGKDNAQVLEYWLDVSLFSRWKKPAKELPWNADVFRKDIDLYAQKGIKHITTFAVYIDSAYVETYKDLAFLREYGNGLESYQPK